MNVFELEAILRLNTTEYDNGLDEAATEGASLGDKMVLVGGQISQVGSALESVSAPARGLFQTAVSHAQSFEYGMAKVQAISGVVGEELDAVKDKALEMASKTKFTTAEAAEALQYMAMAGWEGQQMLGGLPSIMYLAAASGESLGRTSDIVTDAMTAFGMVAGQTATVLRDGLEVEVEQTSRMADVLAAASSKSNTNVDMLGESFKYVAPVAGGMGYSIEDVAVALGLMANVGVKASSSGTALRSVLTNLAKPTKSVEVALNKLGISTEDLIGEDKSLMDIMTTLRGAFGGGQLSAEEYSSRLADIEGKAGTGQLALESYTKAVKELEAEYEEGKISDKKYEQSLADLEKRYSEGEFETRGYEEALEELNQAMYGVEAADKAALAASIAGKYGMAGFLGIVNASDEDFNRLTEAINGTTYSVDSMYETMMGTTEGASAQLDSAIDVLYTSLGEKVLPMVAEGTQKITNIVNAFNGLDDGMQKGIMMVVGAVAAVGPAVTIIGKAVSGIGVALNALGKAPALLASLANPIGIAVAAVAALTAGFVYLYKTNEDFASNAIEKWNMIKEAFLSLEEKIQPAIQRIRDAIAMFTGGDGSFDDIMQSLEPAFKAVFNVLAGAAVGIINAIEPVVNAVSYAFELVANLIAAIQDVFTQDFDGAAAHLQVMFDDVIGIFTSKFEAIGAILRGVLEGMGVDVDALIEAIKGIVDNCLGWIGDFLGNFGITFTASTEGIKETAGGILDWIRDVIGKVFDWGSGVIEWVKGVGQAIADAVTSSPIWQSLVNLFDAIKEFVPTWWNYIISEFQKEFEILRNWFSGVIATTKAVWETIYRFYHAEIENIIATLKVALTNAFDWVKTFLYTAWKVVENTLSMWIDILAEIIRSITSLMQGDLEGAFDHIAEAFRRFGEGFLNNWKILFQNIGDFFGRMGERMKDWGKDLIDNFLGGINEKIETVKDTFTNVANTVRSFLHFSEPDEGPLSDFHTYAPDMMKLFAEGIRENEGLVTDQIARSFDFSDVIADQTVTVGGAYARNAGTVTVNMTIYGAEGQDVNALADIISEKMNAAVNRRQVAMGAV